MYLGNAIINFLSFFAACIIDHCLCLKDLRISVPHAIRKGETAVLMCDFDLEGDSLYSVKWYKGRREFYRFTPKDEFPIKTFPIERASIEKFVDISKSNMTQLTLVGVQPSLSGVYNCEVSAESPSFHTELKSGEMNVVEVPHQNPRIMGLKPKYNIGETLEGMCVSGASRPAANLTWFINGEKVHKDYVSASTSTKDGRDVTKSRINIVVKTHSFINGKLKLRCLAWIHNVYSQMIEQDVFEDRPGTNPGSTKIVVVPSNFLEKTDILGDNEKQNFKEAGDLEVGDGDRLPQLSMSLLLFPLLLLVVR